MKSSLLSRDKLISVSVLLMVISAWALDKTEGLSQSDIDQMEVQYALEERMLELEILEFQLQLKEHRITTEQYQESVDAWARQERSRLAAHNDRAALLDKLRPLPIPAKPVPSPPASIEEAEFRQVEEQVEAILRSLRGQSGDALEAQQKIANWSETPEGQKLRQRMEDLQIQLSRKTWNIQSIILEAPENPTPTQRRALDLQEEILGKWLAIKASVPDGDVVEIQRRVAEAGDFFSTRREEFQKISSDADLETLRSTIHALKEGISPK